MASQLGGFVHLFAASANGEHEPQVFRMRHDQSLRKLMRAYMAFRQFPKSAMAQIEAKLQLSAPDRGLGFLDPSVTAGTCGLADGDRVLVHGAPPTPLPQPVPPAAATAAAGAGAPELAMPPPAMPPPPPPAAREAEPPAAQEPLQSLLATQAEPVRRAGRRSAAEASVTTPARGRGNGRKRDQKPEGEVEFDEGPEGAAEEKGAGVEGEGAGWVELTPREAPREGRGRARGRGAAEEEVSWTVVEAGQPEKPPTKTKQRRGRARDVPASARAARSSRGAGAARARPGKGKKIIKRINVPVGPAKGWQVTAWVKDSKTEGKNRHWRMRSPRRSRVYSSFRSSAGRLNLRDEVSEAVYDQIFRTVRPELICQINDRKARLEGVRFTAPRNGMAFAEAGAVPLPAPVKPKRQRRDPVTPVKAKPAQPEQADDSALLATQCFFTPAKERAAANDWTCGCDAHLRRHARCVSSGPGQPPLVHLKEHTTIGRHESNDLVLESRLTPQMISRSHAEVVREKAGGSYRIFDKKSTNGVLVNGTAVSEGRTLKPGDHVTFGVQTMHPEFDYVFETRPGSAGETAVAEEEAEAAAGDMEVEAPCEEPPQAEPAEPERFQERGEAEAEAVGEEEAADLKGAKKMNVDTEGANEEPAATSEDKTCGTILPEAEEGQGQEDDEDGEPYDEEEDKNEKGDKELDKNGGADCKMEQPEAEVKQEQAEEEMQGEEEGEEPGEQNPEAEAAEAGAQAGDAEVGAPVEAKAEEEEEAGAVAEADQREAEGQQEADDMQVDGEAEA